MKKILRNSPYKCCVIEDSKWIIKEMKETKKKENENICDMSIVKTNDFTAKNEAMFLNIWATIK